MPVTLEQITAEQERRATEEARRQQNIADIMKAKGVTGSGELASGPTFPTPPPMPTMPGFPSRHIRGVQEDPNKGTMLERAELRGRMGLAAGRPEAEVDMLKSQYPNATVRYDAEGRAVATVPELGATDVFLNAPGSSQRDADQIAITAIGMLPIAKAAGAAKSVIGGTMAAMGGGAAEVAGQQALVHEMAGTPISTTDIAIGSAGAGLFQLVPPQVIKGVTSFIRSRGSLDRSVLMEMKRLGMDPDTLTNEQKAELMRLADVSPENLRRGVGMQLEEEFGVPLTEFGRTGEKAGREVRARQVAPAEFEAFDAQQARALKEGADKVHRNLSPQGVPVAHSLEEGVGILAQGVKWRARKLGDKVDDAYDEFREAAADFRAEPVQKLFRSLREKYRYDYDIEDGLDPGAPMARRAIDQLENIARQADGLNPEITAEKLNAVRRRITTWRFNAKGSDRVAMNGIVKDFDDFMDTAIDSALIRGDTEIIDKLREANALRTKYGRKWEENTFGKVKDVAGRNVQRIVEQDLGPSEVVSLVFGRARIGNRAGSLATVKRLKESLGTQSTEWQALREAAWLHVAKPRSLGFEFSPKHFIRDLNNALNGDGAAVMREIFDVDERKMIMRFGELVRRSIPSYLKQTAAGGARFEEEVASAIDMVAKKYAGAFQLSGNKLGSIGLRSLPEIMNRFLAHRAIYGVPPPAPQANLSAVLSAVGTAKVVQEEN